MQVSSSNGLQNRYFSGTGSIGGIHLPDFNDKYVFSKKKSGTSDEEYRKRIRKQADCVKSDRFCGNASRRKSEISETAVRQQIGRAHV